MLYYLKLTLTEKISAKKVYINTYLGKKKKKEKKTQIKDNNIIIHRQFIWFLTGIYFNQEITFLIIPIEA